MILIKMELHSAVDGSVEEIGRATLCNDGTGSDSLRNYDLKIFRRGCTSINGPIWKTGRIKNFASKRYSVWLLLFKALRSAFYYNGVENDCEGR